MPSVAIQMDPPGAIDPTADSTFVLALEAQRRGYTVYTYQPQDLIYAPPTLAARAQLSHFRRPAQAGEPHVTLEPPATIDLAAVDVVLMRQDPPFDIAYITATYLLETLAGRALVVNDPRGVRDAPEKLLVTRFAHLSPATLVTREIEALRAFRREHGDIVVKPLHGNGGAGVFRVRPDDPNFGSMLETLLALSPAPLVAQIYLPAVTAGDKRIVLVEGEPVGAVLRVPQRGEARANMHAGGQPVQAGITAREREICAAIGPTLRRMGLTFAGIDVIGDWLTEINVTSPTGLQEIARLDGLEEGARLEARIWDAIEARRAAGAG